MPIDAGPPWPPLEPPPSRWRWPRATEARGDVIGIGADLEPATLLAAYRAGIFPMPVEGQTLAWWSPERRAVLPLDGLRVPRSLRQAARRFSTRVDTAFDEVVAACADPARPGAWITDEVAAAYGRLHALGWAHSVETWRGSELAGGLYGVLIGRLFAGESMFHRARDASKVALVALVERLRAIDVELLDVQWLTPHLASLGAVEWPRERYLEAVAAAVSRPASGPLRREPVDLT